MRIVCFRDASSVSFHSLGSYSTEILLHDIQTFSIFTRATGLLTFDMGHSQSRGLRSHTIELLLALDVSPALLEQFRPISAPSKTTH